jgi:hypothetical protein
MNEFQSTYWHTDSHCALHAHLTLQSDEMSEEFYLLTYSNYTFMIKGYVLGHFKNVHIYNIVLACA